MRFLVGFDGDDGGRDALELTRVLAHGLGADVLVVTVIPYGPLPVPAVRLQTGHIPEVEPLLAEARKQLEGLDVETRAFGGGTPAGVLTEVAEAEDCDLLILGSPHRGPVGRALIGSTANSLLAGSPCALVVAPRAYAAERHEPFELIGVAYDGTSEAKAALHRAERTAAAFGARLRLLTVVAPPIVVGVIGYVPPQPPDPEALVESARRSIDPKLEAESEVLSGPPGKTLAEACGSEVDLIVAGSRGYGPLMRVLLGSVTRRLIQDAPYPVLIVPRP
jgi:nucleotide-binding universal stress UspA family protein